MRAYLRLDPNLADKKAPYPDGAFRAFVEVLCFAEQQPARGYFRNDRLLRVLLEKRAKWVPFLIANGDLRVETDGRLYVETWLEWQEGDVTVPERMARLRARKASHVTEAVTLAVTLADTPPGVTDPSSGKRLAVSGKRLAEVAHRNNGSPTFMGYRPKASLEDVQRQHDAGFQLCVDCGVRRGAHKADHAFAAAT